VRVRKTRDKDPPSEHPAIATCVNAADDVFEHTAPPGTPRQSNGPAFVEFASPAMVAKQCRFELDNGAGATMPVQLVGYDAADVEALSRSFWNAL
jgi:hypothetical protein